MLQQTSKRPSLKDFKRFVEKNVTLSLLNAFKVLKVGGGFLLFLAF